MMNYLYLGSSKDLIDKNFVKKGYTSDPVSRLDTYNTGYPHKPFIFEYLIQLYLDDDVNGETIEAFCSEDIKSTKDIGGQSGTEWFSREDMNINHIKNIR